MPAPPGEVGVSGKPPNEPPLVSGNGDVGHAASLLCQGLVVHHGAEVGDGLRQQDEVCNVTVAPVVGAQSSGVIVRVVIRHGDGSQA